MSVESIQMIHLENGHQPNLLTRYIRILLKSKWFILITTTLVAIGSVAYAYISKTLPPERSPMPNVYESSAHLLIKGSDNIQSSTVYTVADALGYQTPRTTTVGTDYGQLSIRILKSASFLDLVVEKMDIVNRYGIQENVKTMARKVVLDHLKHSYDPMTGFFTLSYVSTDPEFACDVVNTCVDLLNQWFATTGSMNKKKRLILLEEKLASVKDEIRLLEEKIKVFQRDNNVLTKEELTSTQARMLIDLRTQLVLKEMEIRNYARFSNIEDPALARFRSERKNLADLIKMVEEGVWIDGLLLSRSNLPDLALEFEHMQIDLSLKRRIHEALAEQYELAKLSLEDSAVFQIIDHAEISELKVGPQRMRMVIVQTLGTFFLTVVISLAWHRLKRIFRELKAA